MCSQSEVRAFDSGVDIRRVVEIFQCLGGCPRGQRVGWVIFNVVAENSSNVANFIGMAYGAGFKGELVGALCRQKLGKFRQAFDEAALVKGGLANIVKRTQQIRVPVRLKIWVFSTEIEDVVFICIDDSKFFVFAAV